MTDTTTISVSEQTADAIYAKSTRTESYDDALRRLLDLDGDRAEFVEDVAAAVSAGGGADSGAEADAAGEN